MHSIFTKENASRFRFYTHNRLRIKALLSAVNITLLPNTPPSLPSRPQRRHPPPSAVHVIFLSIFFSPSLTRSYHLSLPPNAPHVSKLSRVTHADNHTQWELQGTNTLRAKSAVFFFSSFFSPSGLQSDKNSWKRKSETLDRNTQSRLLSCFCKAVPLWGCQDVHKD